MANILPTPDIKTSTDSLLPTFEAIAAAQQDLEVPRKEVAIDSSYEIHPVTEAVFESDGGIDLEALHNLGSVSRRELHRLRKVSEVYENMLQVRLPTGAIYRGALTAGKITTIGGIIIAMNGVHDAVADIITTSATDGRSAVTDDQIDEFYFASGVFIGELVLMATPLSANFAFQATGRLHSRLLWHRFNNPAYRSAYRLLLHHIYYLFNGLPSLVLHSLRDVSDRVTDFVESVVFIVRITWEAFDEPAVLAESWSLDSATGIWD